MQSNTSTTGVRAWRRLSSDPSLPLDQRVVETTDPEAMGEALAAADFVTIPRHSADRLGGYTDAYARAFSDALADRYGFIGGVRVSASGRSHVVEREAIPTGGSIDLGLSADSLLVRPSGGDGAMAPAGLAPRPHSVARVAA